MLPSSSSRSLATGLPPHQPSGRASSPPAPKPAPHRAARLPSVRRIWSNTLQTAPNSPACRDVSAKWGRQGLELVSPRLIPLAPPSPAVGRVGVVVERGSPLRTSRNRCHDDVRVSLLHPPQASRIHAVLDDYLRVHGHLAQRKPTVARGHARRHRKPRLNRRPGSVADIGQRLTSPRHARHALRSVDERPKLLHGSERSVVPLAMSSPSPRRVIKPIRRAECHANGNDIDEFQRCRKLDERECRGRDVHFASFQLDLGNGSRRQASGARVAMQARTGTPDGRIAHKHVNRRAGMPRHQLAHGTTGRTGRHDTRTACMRASTIGQRAKQLKSGGM